MHLLMLLPPVSCILLPKNNYFKKNSSYNSIQVTGKCDIIETKRNKVYKRCKLEDVELEF